MPKRTSSPLIPVRRAALPDPPLAETPAHQLREILIIATCAVFCGANSWVAIETFGRDRLPWLHRSLSLPNGIPSHETFRHVFTRLDPAHVQQYLRAPLLPAQSRTSRRSGAAESLSSPSHRTRRDTNVPNITVWATANRMVVAPTSEANPGSLQDVLPEVLALLALRGCHVTLDTPGCQPSVAQQVVAQGAEYVFAIPVGLTMLHQKVRNIFARAQATQFGGLAHDYAQTLQGAPKQEERHTCWTISDPQIIADLDPHQHWPRLRSLGMVQVEHSGRSTPPECRYYLTSLSGHAVGFVRAVRGLWQSAPSAAWVLDIRGGNAASPERIRNGMEHLARLRQLARQLLRQERSVRVASQAASALASQNAEGVLTRLSEGTAFVQEHGA
ncbi:MAG: ISAs1 family transposase [Chloroflexales bacterium]|nr:ISAs1 family transposase [Chloroflexales bacterium]